MSEHANHATGHGHTTPAHSDAQPSPATQAINVRLRPLPGLIFASRWLQLPLYLGLIVAQAVYVQHFLMELWHLVRLPLATSTHCRRWWKASATARTSR